MTYRVINLSTGEIEAELSDFGIAKRLADKIANDVGHREVIGVVELVTRYETPLADQEHGGSQ
ncbi:hypothetical protein AAFX91_30125 [Bradyrhizobium sp. 31Argb]|uniref:hypothetical protein n=1 Tax=Bradyrhizobium TaxID=374 RepID=UPI0004005CB7|nr:MULTISPECIES: hypothetical protein [Bradyrhizobium]TAI61098.1 hypothetical protein CWO89_37025 [Bradyrhizobium sp. Leo170]